MKFIIIILSLIIPLYTAEETNSSATVSYSLLNWVGPFSIERINVTAPSNSNFYDVMELAAQQFDSYKFEAKDYDFGHYITEIGGAKEIPSKKIHWMLYKLPTVPDIWTIPSDEFLTPKGVDETFIKHGENYLFWYHRLRSLEH